LLARGERLTELLKQPQYKPLPVEEQVVAIYAGVKGFIDTVPVIDVTRFEEGLMSAVRANHTDILDAIREQQAISDETDAKLKTAIETYANSFVAS